MSLRSGAVHFVIPDSQVKPGVPTDHLTWIGQYLVDQFKGREDVTVVHLGDFWDFPSLSSYDKGKKSMEGRRYADDVAAGNAAFRRLNAPLIRYNAGRKARGLSTWDPRLVFLLGNHENRVNRAVDCDAQLEGTISLDDCDTLGWERHGFLKPVFIDGIGYSHYWVNPGNGRPLGGMIETRLKTIGHSFTQGHTQTLLYGIRPSRTAEGAASFHQGLVAGAAYLHTEDYLGPQGNDHWRGIVVKHEVRDGMYDPMMVSLDYLCRRYEGVSLAEFRLELGLAA